MVRILHLVCAMTCYIYHGRKLMIPTLLIILSSACTNDVFHNGRSASPTAPTPGSERGATDSGANKNIVSSSNSSSSEASSVSSSNSGALTSGSNETAQVSTSNAPTQSSGSASHSIKTLLGLWTMTCEKNPTIENEFFKEFIHISDNEIIITTLKFKESDCPIQKAISKNILKFSYTYELGDEERNSAIAEDILAKKITESPRAVIFLKLVQIKEEEDEETNAKILLEVVSDNSRAQLRFKLEDWTELHPLRFSYKMFDSLKNNTTLKGRNVPYSNALTLGKPITLELEAFAPKE